MKVLLSLAVALALFWYLYRNSFSDTLKRMIDVDYGWVALSLLLGTISHGIRAVRWKMMMEATGYHPSTGRSLGALFIGYLVNLAVPRLGEVSRCLVLRRTDRVPVSTAIGTVVGERVVDILFLLLIFGITLMVEFEKLIDVFSSLLNDKISGLPSLVGPLIWYGGILVLLLVALWMLFKHRIRKQVWWRKLRIFVKQTWTGITSIRRMKKQRYFWMLSLAMWLVYFFVGYAVFFAMTETAGLGWRAALSLLAVGGIAMSAPVQGGIGAYHLLVSALLIYYGVEKNIGLSFAFLIHTSQTLLVIFAGLVALVGVLNYGPPPPLKTSRTSQAEVKNI